MTGMNDVVYVSGCFCAVNNGNEELIMKEAQYQAFRKRGKCVNLREVAQCGDARCFEIIDDDLQHKGNGKG